MAIFSLLVKSEFFFIICRVILDLNVTVVFNPPSYSGLDDRRAFDLAEAVCWSQRAGDRRKQVVDVRWASPRSSWRWLLRQWNVQTIKMPMESTKIARNYGAIWSRCSSMTLVTKDSLSFAVLQLKIIRLLVITRALSFPRIMSGKSEQRYLPDLLCFRWGALFILSFCPSLDILEVLANIFREVKCAWIFPLQIGEKSTEATISVRQRSSSCETNIAKPFIWERTLIDRRINAFEVEGASAAIATH